MTGLNQGPLVSEAPTLSTVRQPLPNELHFIMQTEESDQSFLIFLEIQVSSKDVYCIGICGQSYKHFTLVNYDSRVEIWGIFQSGTTLES